MIATSYQLTDEPRQASMGLVHISMFDLQAAEEVPAQEILQNPHISLYYLDFESRQAVFVETPPDINLSLVSFYFVTQYETATRVLTISFDTMLKLADSLTANDSQLVFIHSVGRCGSTLASQLFAQIPSVFNLSEPDALTNLVVARNNALCDETELISLLRATVRLLCQHSRATTIVIKGRSFVIELGDLLHTLFPKAKHLFLYRDAVTWLRSNLRAFGRRAEVTEEEEALMEKQRRGYLGALVPAISQFDPHRFLPHSGALSLMWLTAMERYVGLCQLDIDTLAIRYSGWLQNPRETAEAMLAFCQSVPSDMSLVYETLKRDSQADTPLSRGILNQKDSMLADDDLAELQWHLQNHPFINTADFAVPNTL